MKTYIRNVAILNMLHATPESVEEIAGIGNVAVIVVTEKTKQLLGRMEVDSIASVVLAPDDAEPVVVNGEYTLCALPGPARLLLLVNGMLTVDAAVTPGDIARTVCGGLVNGEILATDVQAAALSAAGVAVNGGVSAYPDGARLRGQRTPLSAAEAGAMDAPVYLARRASLEPGVPGILQQKGLTLHGARGAVVQEADAAAFYAIWRGSGDVVQVPQGYTLLQGDRSVTRQTAPLLLRGSRMVAGNLSLREDVEEKALAALEALWVGGRLVVPEPLLEALLPRLHSEPELIPYQGTLVQETGVLDITEGLLAPLDRAAFVVDGVTSIAPDLSPQLLRERVSLLYVDGVLNMTPRQQAALAPVLLGSYQISEGGQGDEDAGAQPGGDVRIVGNAASYVL